MTEPATGPFEEQLAALRRRADEDFVDPPALRAGNRHQVDLSEIGLRVSVTRSLYPNRPDGHDQYAITISRAALDRAPDAAEVDAVLGGLFGGGASQAEERSGGPLVRLYRVAATT